MEKKYKLGVIGCGFMGSAIIEGILNKKVISPNKVIVSNRNNIPLIKMKEKGICTTCDNKDLVTNSEFVLLAVKPQSLSDLMEEIKNEKVEKIISILAGVKKDKIKGYIKDAKVARCMPNTPCSIGYGVVCVDSSDFFSEDKEFIASIFNSLGESMKIEESKMNAVTGISGSGPAYVYMFIEGLIKAGINQGLSFIEAKKLAVSTVIGAGNMIKQNNDKKIEDFINAVCSKGGTTIEAVNSFKSDNLYGIIDRAVDCCVKRAFEIGGEKVKDKENSFENKSDSIKKTSINSIINNEEVTIYTDGACSGNPGEGGWGAVLIKGEKYKELSGGEINTTNNRMELKGVIEGLKTLKKSCKVKLYSDSSYVINAFNKGWVKNWDTNGWKNSSGDDVKNIDLWEQLLTLTSIHEVEFIKVKGHADNKYNNRCDILAVSEWKKLKS